MDNILYRIHILSNVKVVVIIKMTSCIVNYNQIYSIHIEDTFKFKHSNAYTTLTNIIVLFPFVRLLLYVLCYC